MENRTNIYNCTLGPNRHRAAHYHHSSVRPTKPTPFRKSLSMWGPPVGTFPNLTVTSSAWFALHLRAIGRVLWH
jgi:hypothetical protein